MTGGLIHLVSTVHEKYKINFLLGTIYPLIHLLWTNGSEQSVYQEECAQVEPQVAPKASIEMYTYEWVNLACSKFWVVIFECKNVAVDDLT